MHGSILGAVSKQVREVDRDQSKEAFIWWARFIKLFTLSLYINLDTAEVMRRINRAPTCPISDGQVVPFL